MSETLSLYLLAQNILSLTKLCSWHLHHLSFTILKFFISFASPCLLHGVLFTYCFMLHTRLFFSLYAAIFLHIFIKLLLSSFTALSKNVFFHVHVILFYSYFYKIYFSSLKTSYRGYSIALLLRSTRWPKSHWHF